MRVNKQSFGLGLAAGATAGIAGLFLIRGIQRGVEPAAVRTAELEPAAVEDRGLSQLRDEIARLRLELRSLATATAAAAPASAAIEGVRSEVLHGTKAGEAAAGSILADELRRMFSLLFWCTQDGGGEVAEMLEDHGRSPFEPGLLDLVERTCRRLHEVDQRALDERRTLKRQLGIDVGPAGGLDAVGGLNGDALLRKQREDLGRAWRPREAALEHERRLILEELAAALSGG